MRHKNCTPLQIPLGKLRAAGYSKSNADAQRMTVSPKQGLVTQRGSWWVGKPREDFTALASVMVVPPVEKTATIYKWRDNNYD